MSDVRITHLGKEFVFDAGAETDYIHKEIVATRQFFEQRLLDYIRLTYPTHDRILDIGANFGNHSIFFDAFLRHEAIDCFEPYPPTFERLANNVNFATCHNVALGARDDVGVGTMLGEDNAGTWCISAGHPDGDIRIVPLDSFGFNDVTLMKIDVEWMELEVLKGALSTIERCRPVIVLEAGTLEFLLPIATLMEQYGYRCQWFRGLVPDPPGAPTSLGTTWVLTP